MKEIEEVLLFVRLLNTYTSYMIYRCEDGLEEIEEMLHFDRGWVDR